MVHPLAGPSAASANQTCTGVPGCNKQPLKHMLVLLLACIVLVENQKIDWYYAACRPRLVKAMTEQLEKMQNQYDALANQMSEATVHPEAMDQPFVYIYGWLMCTFIHYENSFAISCAFVILHHVLSTGSLSQVISQCGPAELCELHEAGCWHEQLGPAFKDSWLKCSTIG